MTLTSAGIIGTSGGGGELTTTIESWEGASPLDSWAGDTGTYAVVGSGSAPSAILVDGDQCIEKQYTGSFETLTSVDSGPNPLDRYPQEGDHLRTVWRSDGSHARIIFRFGDGGGDKYDARFQFTDNFNSDALQLFKDGTQQAATTLSSAIVAGQNYYLDVHWNDETTATDEIEAEVIEAGGSSLGAISFTDASYSGGFVEFSIDEMASGETTWGEWIHVRQ